MNTTYFDLQSQIQSLNSQMAALTKQAEQVRTEERNPAIAEIQKLISTYSIKSSELFPRKNKDQVKKSKKSPAKFRNPATGEEWSGRGNTPNWIKGKDYSQYLIVEPAASPIIDPVTTPLIELVADAAPTPLSNPVIDPVVSPVNESVADLASIPNPIINPVSSPAINPAGNPVLTLVANPIVDQVVSQVVEPIDRLVAESA